MSSRKHITSKAQRHVLSAGELDLQLTGQPALLSQQKPGSVTDSVSKKKVDRLGRWSSSYKHLMLLERTQVSF